MASRRFIDFPDAGTITGAETVLLWQSGANRKTTVNGILAEAGAVYPEALARENNTVLFDNDYVTGIIAAARTGNILFDFTGAKLGATTYMRHQDGSAFTFPAQAVLLFDSADVSTTDANYFCFLLVDKTGAGEEVHVTLAQEGV